MSEAAFEHALAESTSGFGGYLRCETCHATGRVDPCYWRVGWPRCCSYTMRWWTQRQVEAGEVTS